MRLTWNARTRRLLFVVLMLVVLTFPLVSTLLTRARVERQGVDVTASVLKATRNGDSYLVAFRLPKNIDPDQRNFSAEVDRAAYLEASTTDRIGVRVLEDRPTAHRVEGEVTSRTPWVLTIGADLLVLVVGLWWVKVGRRRPPVRLAADADLEPAEHAGPGTLTSTGADLYELVGPVVSSGPDEVVVDAGERRVVVVLRGHHNPVPVGSPVRARGPLVG